MSGRIWDDLITEQDRKVYGSGIFGGSVGIGEHPALVIIDVCNKSIGDEPLPLLEAMATYGKSCCGEIGWATVPKIRSLIDAAHAAGLPIFFTIPQIPDERPADTFSRFDEKMPNWMDYTGDRDGYDFADEIEPVEGDIVIRKPTASSFYLTEFEQTLRDRGVDTIVVTGCSTSGCVRATVVDAHARGFKVNVVEDAVFDRGQVTHAMNLFDMSAKYADVIFTDEALGRLATFEKAASATS